MVFPLLPADLLSLAYRVELEVQLVVVDQERGPYAAQDALSLLVEHVCKQALPVLITGPLHVLLDLAEVLELVVFVDGEPLPLLATSIAGFVEVLGGVDDREPLAPVA